MSGKDDLIEARRPFQLPAAVTDKRPTRSQLDAEVQSFLNSGGAIEKVPQGMSAIDYTLQKLDNGGHVYVDPSASSLSNRLMGDKFADRRELERRVKRDEGIARFKARR